MEITYIGHAGFIVEADGKSILIDPWFYAADLGSSFPYPDNYFMIKDVISQKFDYLYVSHVHTDHFDKRLLESLSRDITILCPSFRSRELELLFRRLGFNSIVKLGHLEEYSLSDKLSVKMLMDISAAEDSALLIEADGFRFLDLNDCQLNAAELPRADVLACQFSGAIHYPQTYEMYSDDDKEEKSNNAIATYVDIFKRKLSAIQPTYFIPSAGPYCFLHPNLRKYNSKPDRATVFLDWERFVPLISDVLPNEQVLRVFPGDVIHADPRTGSSTVEERYSSRNPHPDDTLEAYSSRRASELAPFISTKAPSVSTEDLEAHWAQIQRENKKLLSFRDFSKSFAIEAYEQDGTFLRSWSVTISGQGVKVADVPPPGFVREYTFKIPMLMLRKVIDGETDWDGLISSHHMLLSRDPDVFDPQFFALLRYHHAPARALLFASAAASADEMVPLANDPSVMIQRYCPHNGEDLKDVEACDGVIICPRHRWEWDIETGQCLSGGNLPLRVVHAVQKAD